VKKRHKFEMTDRRWFAKQRKKLLFEMSKVAVMSVAQRVPMLETVCLH
jgi:hypothetical protein